MQFDVRRFDIYRKVPKDLTQPTLIGAAVSICSVLFIIFLMVSELTGFLQTEIVSELFVDLPKDQEKIPVRINISLPRMKCDFVGLDIQDEMGRHEVGFHENTKKIDLHNEQGCRFEGMFYVNRVPGNFHMSTHSAETQPENPDMGHVINNLQFGDVISDNIHGAFKALEGVDKNEANGLYSHDYILKIVPTIYEKLDGTSRSTYQYSWAHKEYFSYGHGHAIMPAIWFRYDLSPITVKYVERRKPLYHFITTVCAIVGGTFTVAGIIDSLIFTAHEVFKKAELGKLS